MSKSKKHDHVDSASGSLIERAEREAGCRWDDPGNPNALAILFSSLARELGQHTHQPKDDLAAGLLLMYQMSEAGQREQRSREMMALMLTAGINPDDLKELMG